MGFMFSNVNFSFFYLKRVYDINYLNESRTKLILLLICIFTYLVLNKKH